MEKPLSIRPACTGDVPSLQEIFDRQENLDKLESYSDQTLIAAIEDSSNLFFVAMSDATLECFIWVTGILDSARGPKIEEFGSRAPGQGCGSILFRHTIDVLLGQQHNRVWLAVASDNLQAIKFYRQFGFVEKNLRKSVWPRRSGDIADGLLMEGLAADLVFRRERAEGPEIGK